MSYFKIHPYHIEGDIFISIPIIPVSIPQVVLNWSR